MKTQSEQVDRMARSGLYHSRPASITSYTNELNTRPKQTDKTQIILKPLKHIQHKLIFTKQSIIKINTFHRSRHTIIVCEGMINNRKGY